MPKLPKRCKTCDHWVRGQTLSVVCKDGDIPSPQGMRKLLHTHILGSCLKIVARKDVKHEKYPDGQWDVVGPLNSIVCDGYAAENQWGSGGTNPPETGPDFGCIHWEKIQETSHETV